MIEAFGTSNIGPVRKTNEDRLLCDHDLNIYIVADGMGGAAAGEVASHIAIETIQGFIRQSSQDSYFTWPFGYDPLLSDAANRLRTALRLANYQILSTALTNDDYHGMGTTAVCALITGDQLTIAHAGDSRCYLYAGGVLTPLTKDDSWIAAMAERRASVDGHITPNRNVLTNALGVQQEAEIHLLERVFNDRDMLLLCSDGLHGVVDDETMASRLMREAPLPELGRDLVETAIASGTEDNVTALLVRYHALAR
jgi:protein phosphatase